MPRIKRGDIVEEHYSGIVSKVIDIQYIHNRYQLKGESGWRYGIENISLA